MFMINKIIDFIEHLFENINIYNTVILYDEKTSTIDELYIKLKEHDFPAYIMTHLDNDINLNKYRVFIMPVTLFNKFISKNRNITIILTLNNTIYKNICDTLINYNIQEKVYIFSCNNLK